ncbi:MAG: hypothetical protein OK454_08860, partial [Thaumarchaeota archaeon]|nr:hypothetical protein [Nitrososphaerota archaeon]
MRLVGGVYPPAQLGVKDGGPHEVCPLVSSTLEVGHEAIDDVRLGRYDVDGVHGRVHLPLLLDSL